MSHLNGRIYIDTSTDPDTGISIDDIRRTLGRGVQDVGLLCSDQEWYDNNGTPTLRRANKVNKWAKNKPFRSSALYTDYDLRKSANFGLYMPYYTTIGNMVSDINGDVWTHAANYDANRTPWEWEPPRGQNRTPKEWYRMFDFNEYYHYAEAMAGQVSSPVLVPVNDTSAPFLFPYHYDQYSIAPSDIVEEGNITSATRYLGICMFTGTNANQRKVYTFGAVSNYDSTSIHSLLGAWNNASVGWYHAFLFISDRAIAEGDTEVQGKYIPIVPSISYVSVQMEPWKLRNMAATATQSGTTVTVNWSVDLQNSVGKQATLQCVYYYYDNNSNLVVYATDTSTVNLVSGANSATVTKTSVREIIVKVNVSLSITDSVHGNEYAETDAFITT